MNKEGFIEIIREWKWAWRKQEERYSHIAHGIDANMIHDLARRLEEALAGKPELSPVIDKTNSVREAVES